MRVIWSPLAIERAYEEPCYISDDKPSAALRWLEGLFRSTDRLQHFPQSGRMVPEIGLSEYREVSCGSHRVIYRLEKRRVLILTIRRSRQLLQQSDILDVEE